MNDCDYPLVLDVSGWQPVGLVPWADFRIAGGIVKATEDAHEQASCRRHCAAVRAASKPLGLYHFFHPEGDVKAQFDAFDYVASHVGYPLATDIVPAIDIEYFQGHGVTAAWNAPLRELVEMFVQAYGASPLLYLSMGTWICLGRPEWVFAHKLWVTFYRAKGLEHPLNLPPKYNPGNRHWDLWQFYGGRLFGKVQESQPAVDHNAATSLPLIGMKT